MKAEVWVYKLLIDPLLKGLRRSVRDHIQPGTTCLDIACGTGSMVFFLKDHCSQVTGIDLDEPKIMAARSMVELKGLSHLDFRIMDATRMEAFGSQRFDYVHLAMAIHQFNPAIRRHIIREALKAGKNLILADYSCPVPNNPGGWLARFIEFLAGSEHHRNFRNYQKTGGMPALLRKMDLDFQTLSSRGVGVFTVYLVKSATTG